MDFILGDNGWRFDIQNIQFLTQYNPEETENISTPIFLTINNYNGKVLFFSEKSPASAKQEIGRNLQNRRQSGKIKANNNDYFTSKS